MGNSKDDHEPFFVHKNSQGKDHVDDQDWGNKGCNWCNLFCFKWLRRNIDMDETNQYSLLQKRQRGEQSTETWWKSKVKKLKQVSEKVAGPKWKNFIRKMSGYCNNYRKKAQKKNRFQYDPHSYALNFDNGNADKELGDEYFSSRFAANERQ